MKGDYERARDQWDCSLLRADMGRGAESINRVIGCLRKHWSRATFERTGQLEAFPSLPRIAFMTGLNEKTVRRAIRWLVKHGFLMVLHRTKNSNVYRFVIPDSLAKHAALCLDLLTNPRDRPEKKQTEAVTNCPDPLDTWESVRCPSVHLTLDRTLELTPISKSVPSERVPINKPRDLEKEKRLSEKLRGLRDELASSDNQLARCFREARKLDARAPAVIGKAMRHWGRDADDVRAAIETVRDDYGGDAGDLAHELWEPER